MRKQFLRATDIVLQRVLAQPYQTGDRLGVPNWIGWGKFTYGSRIALQLLQAWSLTNDEKYV